MNEAGWAHAALRGGAPSVVVFRAGEAELPATVAAWVATLGARAELVRTSDALMSVLLRGRPTAFVADARGSCGADVREAAAVITRAKQDAFAGVTPAVALVDGHDDVVTLLRAGADEVLTSAISVAECEERLAALLRRSTRDTGVHPTTRLPGTPEIEAYLDRCVRSGAGFAMCYADLDHFKEFNDRYGYNEGDRVIRMVALILHDVVAGECGERGFVGHVGGDDFVVVVPLAAMHDVCAMILETFDTLVPYQYSDADRRAGYFFGKDRRGTLHRVPLMTLSIGVVTNERRAFTHASQVSALASEMKSYAKAQAGSGYSVDRRNEPPPDPPRDVTRRRPEERS